MSNEVLPVNADQVPNSAGKVTFFGPPTAEEQARITAELAESIAEGDKVFDPATGRMRLEIGEWNRDFVTRHPVPAATYHPIAAAINQPEVSDALAALAAELRLLDELNAGPVATIVPPGAELDKFYVDLGNYSPSFPSSPDTTRTFSDHPPATVQVMLVSEAAPASDEGTEDSAVDALSPAELELYRARPGEPTAGPDVTDDGSNEFDDGSYGAVDALSRYDLELRRSGRLS